MYIHMRITLVHAHTVSACSNEALLALSIQLAKRRFAQDVKVASSCTSCCTGSDQAATLQLLHCNGTTILQ
jgi:hypothetical protein